MSEKLDHPVIPVHTHVLPEKGAEGKPHHPGPEEAAKVSLEAQMHLQQHANMWVKGNADDSAGGTLPKVQLQHENKGGNRDYSKIKEDAAAADKTVKADGDALKTVTGANDSFAAKIAKQSGDNASLSKDTDVVLGLHDKFFKNAITGTDKKELESMAGLPHQMITEQQRAAVNRVLKDWDKIDDLKTSGPVKLLEKDSVKEGFAKRQEGVDGENKELQKGRLGQDQLAKKERQDEADAAKAHLDIAPIQAVLDASKVQKGDGFYQVAERMLNTDHQKHDDKEIKALMNVLKDEVKAEGRSVKRNDTIVTPENFDAIMSKIGGNDFPVIPGGIPDSSSS